MEVLRNRIHYTHLNRVEKLVELAVRLALLPLRPLVIWPTLKVLEILGYVPYIHKTNFKQLAILCLAFLCIFGISILYILIIFTIGLPVWVADFLLYRRETEEAGLPDKPLPPTAARHGVRKYLCSRYIQSPFFVADLKDETLLHSTHSVSYLPEILPRRGSRPQTLKGLPHRQFNQRPRKEMFKRAENLVFDDTFGTMDGLDSGVMSLAEGTGAKAVRFSNCDEHCLTAQRGEFCHIHNVDGSWHCVLSAADAIKVLRYDWGELWPNTTLDLKKFHAVVLLYAARNDIEMKTVLAILKASHRFAGDVSRPFLNGHGKDGAEVHHSEHDDLDSKIQSTETTSVVGPTLEEELSSMLSERNAQPTKPEVQEFAVETNFSPKQGSLDDFSVSDVVSEMTSAVEESFEDPTGRVMGEVQSFLSATGDEEEKDLSVSSRDDTSELLSRRPISGNLAVTVDRAANLESKDLNGKSDPYVILQVGEDQVKQTKVVRKNLSPKWNQTFNFSIADAHIQRLHLTVKDHDVLSKDDIHGTISILVHDILMNAEETQSKGTAVYKYYHTYPIEGSQGTLKLKLKFALS